MYEINPDKQIELLRWLLSTVENQWLTRSAAVHGPANASKLNARVQGILGKAGLKAVLGLFGKTQARDLSEASQIIRAYLNLVYGETGFSGNFRLSSPDSAAPTRLEIEIASFSGFDPVRKVAQSAGEESGLVTEALWSNWFETLLPDQPLEITVKTNGAGLELITILALTENFIQGSGEELSPIAALLQLPLEPLPPGPGQTPGQGLEKEEISRPLPPFLIGMETRGTGPGGPPGKLTQPAGFSPPGVKPSENLPPGPPPAINYPAFSSAGARFEPGTGRPLFSQDPEEMARRSVEKSKAQKNLPFMSRLLLSKEARELLKQSENSSPVPVVNLALGIEFILQRLIQEEQARAPGSISYPVHIMNEGEGELKITVGARTFSSVGELPPGRIKELLQQAVDEWTAKS